MLPDYEPVDTNLLASLVTRLKSAPQDDVPTYAMDKIAKWSSPPSEAEVKAVISAGGCSTPARRVLTAVLDMVQRLP